MKFKIDNIKPEVEEGKEYVIVQLRTVLSKDTLKNLLTITKKYEFEAELMM